MAFWKKKKIEETKEKEAVVERPVLEAYMGEVIVEISEKEEGTFEDSSIELKDSEYVLRVVNRSSIPVYSTKIELQNTENTDLDSEISIRSLEASGKEGDTFEIKYNVTKYRPPIAVSYEILHPENKGEALWFEEENNVGLKIKIKSNMDVPIDKVQLEYVSEESIVRITPENPEVGQISNYGDRILWVIDGLAPHNEAYCDLNLTIRPADKKKVSLGKINVIISLENATLSAVSVNKATSRFVLNFGLRKNEKMGESGKWEVYVDIINPYEMELKAEGEIEITKGNIISMPDAPYIKQVDKKIVIDGADIAPNSRISIGPFEIESMETPKLKVRLGGGVEEKVFIRAEGKYETTLPDISVMAVDIKKNISLKIDKKIEKFVSPNELPTLGNNKIDVESLVKNIGGSGIGYVKIVETIPIGLSDPEKISVKVDGKSIKTYTHEITESGKTEKERELIIELKGEDTLPSGSELKISYTLKPQKIPIEIVQLEFPMKVYCAYSPDMEMYEKLLPVDDIPYVKVRHITRSVNVLKQVTPAGKDEFVLRLSIENSGEDPVPDYEVKQTIPKTFKIIEVSPEANVEETDRTILSWKMTLEPHETKTITIKVKGEGEYAIEDLMEAEAI